MKKATKLGLNILAASLVAFGVSGCTSLQETMASQMEVPTLEKQANRVAIGMTIVRENNIMAYKMKISADAEWPALVAADLNGTQKKAIKDRIMDEPYFATVQYTDSIQRKALGSGALMSMLGGTGNLVAQVLDQKISPMTYRAVQKLELFYGPDQDNWPNIFDFDGSLESFLDFKDGTMQEIDSPTGDVYDTLGEAMIALTPVNLQKDLGDAREDMLSAFEATADVTRQKAELETNLQIDEAKVKEAAADYTPMSEVEKEEIKIEIALLDVKIEEAESIAEEKELVYFELIDGAVLALESDINLDDENYIKLAQNLNLAADQIQVGATEAGTSFGLALTNILANNIVFKFPTELESLVQATRLVPGHLQEKYAQRIARLAKNALYLLPNMAIGTYYASKQASVAGKYKDVTDVIIEAHETKLEQEEEAAEAQKEAQEKLAEEELEQENEDAKKKLAIN